jgi:dsRNA-specific ribonuclease
LKNFYFAKEKEFKRMEPDQFKAYLQSILRPCIPEEYLVKMLSEGPYENYFIKAFTHKTFIEGREDAEFNYEVLEKVGDKILGAAFQFWLYDVIGEQTNSLQTFSDIEKRFVGKEFLAELADALEITKWIKIVGATLNQKIKSDVVEALIAAIALSADNYVVQDFGIVLAKRWVYQVYNTFARERIDPKNATKYVDYRSRLNEIWQFNGWGVPLYKTSTKVKDMKEFAAVDAIGPDIPAFPQKYRNAVLGSGQGKNLEEAQETASKNALEMLGISYAEFKGFEIQFDNLEISRIEKALKDSPEVFARLQKALVLSKNLYEKISIKTAKIDRTFTTQLRVQIEGIWKNYARGRDPDKTQSIIKAVNFFIDGVNKEFQ